MTLTESDTHMFKLLREYIEQRNALRSKEPETLDDDDECEHLRREEDGGTPFCVDCGFVFEDETQFVYPYGGAGFRNPTTEQEGDEDEQDEDEQDEDEQDEDEQDEDEDEPKPRPKPKPKPKPKRKSKPKRKPKPKQKPMTTPEM